MPRKHNKNKKSFFGRPVWRNSTKTISVHPLRFYQPETLDDLKEMVQEAIDTNTTIRAVGSGHSFSDAPQAEGILLDTDHLNKLSKYKFSKAENLFEVEGGIKVKELNKRLDQAGYCIPTMGGIDHQSIAGALSTGTHGSSLDFGAMSKMIKSIVLVTHDQDDPKKVKVYRIERSGNNSITDTAGYTGPEIIKDDAVFHSAVVCFGSMGIIYSYVLEVEKMYYLLEKKEVSDWPTVKDKLRNRRVFQGHRSVFVQINPYLHKGKQLALLVYHDDYVDTDQNLLVQQIKHKVFDRIKRSRRSFQFEVASLLPYFVWIMIWRINRFPGFVPKFINNAVKSQKDDEYINKGYKVMYQGLDYVKERAFDCEIAIQVDSGDEYLEVIENVMQYLRYMSEEYKVHITSPLGLRFVKSSEAFMTPESGYDVCYIDTPVLKKIYGGDVIINKLQQFLLVGGARPHWGKRNDLVDLEYTQSNYPKYNVFIQTIKLFNPSKIFSNLFTKRVIGY